MAIGNDRDLHDGMMRIVETVRDVTSKHPKLRGKFASGMLGVAYAFAKECGIDSVAFIEQLEREQSS